ncbi:MAG TPA: Rieske 2Fe-2S domain-containing protein [Ilumatobacteraceae bacterium]|nr:Rieske 2Fe-2S domain-containing protein [Ilumatobacteraceae bacterium]
MNTAPLPTATATPVGHIDDLAVGSMKMIRVDNHRLCLVRTSEGVFALEHACPHEGYGMTQGSLDGNLITCAWHNWKFRVDDGECVVGEENINTHPAAVDDDGTISVTLRQPDVEAMRPRLLASLRRGVERNYIGQVSRDVVRLLQADANPGELVWEAVNHGAPRADFGWGHSIASATDCLAMVGLYEGDQRALPIVQAIAGIAETERDRPINRLPEPVRVMPRDPRAAFRVAVEAERLDDAQALVRGAIAAGHSATELQQWFTAVASDHLLSYGHGAIYCQKAFELLEMIGWHRADTVLPHLVPTIVYGTREDLLPYTRPFVRALNAVDLDALASLPTESTWSDDGTLLTVLLGDNRRAIVPAVVECMRGGAGVDGILDVVVQAVGERMMRYDLAGERDLLDDFGWLDITHGLTYANAARWHHRMSPGPDTVRLTMFTAFLAQWTGRHEWHTLVAERADGRSFTGTVAEAGDSLQREALLDNASAFIVYAHGIKTSRAAAAEAQRSGSMLPLQAVARLLDSPRLERFVAANVARSIEFLAGRAPRDEAQGSAPTGNEGP